MNKDAVDDRIFLAVKQAVSVQRQLGKEGVVSKLYGVTQWDCSFKTFKLQGDWPGSIFYQSSWYKKFSNIEDYYAPKDMMR